MTLLAFCLYPEIQHNVWIVQPASVPVPEEPPLDLDVLPDIEGNDTGIRPNQQVRAERLLERLLHIAVPAADAAVDRSGVPSCE